MACHGDWHYCCGFSEVDVVIFVVNIDLFDYFLMNFCDAASGGDIAVTVSFEAGWLKWPSYSNQSANGCSTA